MEIQRTFSTTKQTMTIFDSSASSSSNPSPQTAVWAASLTERGTKSFLITVKESPSTTRNRNPIIRANSNDLSHARASAMNASATSSIR
ncbi:hypothetical protein ES288_A06G062100v1 [Gossypium darwinii]|uniref:Uncharacterized protein n=2 Tax=Gossypium TaxID=3633 RepID=A0A5D2Q0R1_GOSTO|nr:hypothetical protein ES288_A06G062100v1 [Gossypium darwinii]TYI21772.1 hypothetical protein ES332_A06G061200v1 [Gossypium tomentosum]